MTMPVRPGSRTDPRRWQRGVATVEAVLVVPLVLVPVLLSVIVFGRLAHTRLVLDAAAAAGARQAAVVGGDSALVRSRIATELSDGGLDPNVARVVVEPSVVAWGSRFASDFDRRAGGDPVRGHLGRSARGRVRHSGR